MASVFVWLDAQLDNLFAGWNIWSTTLICVLLAVLASPLFFGSEPDIHPFLLSRQSNASPVRQSGESAVYRSLDVPHGYPLRSGLNVKDEGAPKWGPGRNGDLRDIWRNAAKGAAGQTGKILILRGKNAADTATFEDVSKQINAIGKQIKSQNGSRVAILLPNSVEFLVALFACAFYGLVPVLIPIETPQDKLQEVLQQTQVDAIIAPGGVISAQDLATALPKAKSVIWVTSPTVHHLEAVEISEDSSNSSEWRSIITSSNADSVLPADTDPQNAANIISVWQVENGSGQTIEYTQGNLIASVAAQLAALPHNQILKATDLVVSLSSWTQSYPLSITLAALYANASIAVTSSAGLAPDYGLAFQGNIKPSVVIASATTMSKAHGLLLNGDEGFFQKFHKSRHAGYLAAGTMRAVNTQSPRLIYISSRTEEVPLSSQDVNDLRIFTGSRIIRGLTIPDVVGAVTQTNPLDYRINSSSPKSSPLGPPLSCVELKLVEGSTKISDEDYKPLGQVLVAGPAVVGKAAASTGITAKIADDHTLQLV